MALLLYGTMELPRFLAMLVKGRETAKKSMEITQIKKIIRKWPAYRKFIENKGVRPEKIKDLSDLPVTDKQFISSAIHMIPLFKVRNIIPSSGSTGDDFSFGLFGDTDIKKTSCTIDTMLRKRFHTAYKKTLLVNMLPGAVSLQSSAVSVASIGVRTDTAISVIKSFGSSFDQLILAAEPLFMKNLIELGIEKSIPWKHIPLYILIGGEWTPFSYGNYLETMAGPQRVYSLMGMAELGLNFFFETDETILLRKILFEDPLFRRTLLGDADFCPMLFEYDENEIYIETVGSPLDPFDPIVLTTTDPGRALPLIRYDGGDKGKVLSRDEINRALAFRRYLPVYDDSGPPVLAHFGRGTGHGGLFPEKIKEIIYGSKEIASTTTGNFRLCKEEDAVLLKIQMKEGISPSRSHESDYYKAFGSLPLQIRLFSFEKFPHLLDFERKIRYVCESNPGKGKRGEKVGVPLAV